jgi:hypothetical protein
MFNRKGAQSHTDGGGENWAVIAAMGLRESGAAQSRGLKTPLTLKKEIRRFGC